MKTKEAIEIVENYNLRLKGDKDIPKINPETITVAIDTVIKIVKNLDLPHVRLSLFNYIDSLNDKERISLFKEIKKFRPEKRGWCSKCGKIMPEECNGFH